MYDIFQRFRTIILFAAIIPFFSACEKNALESHIKAGPAVRLTAGVFEDSELSFSPAGGKVLILRNYPPAGQDVRNRGGLWQRRIFELDFSDPRHPKEHEIEELAEATEVSYMGSSGAIFAKDRSNIPVIFNKGKLTPAPLRDLKSIPSRLSVSPDGRYLAFMAVETPALEPGKVPSPEDFAYNPYVADLQSGNSSAIVRDLGPRAYLEDMWWKKSGRLCLFYRFEDPDSQIFRVDEYDIASGRARLAFIANGGAYFRLSEDNSFYVTHMLEQNNVSFVSRDHKTRVDINIEGELQGVSLPPDNRRVIVARYCDDTHGINLFMVETPAQFLQT